MDLGRWRFIGVNSADGFFSDEQAKNLRSSRHLAGYRFESEIKTYWRSFVIQIHQSYGYGQMSTHNKSNKACIKQKVHKATKPITGSSVIFQPLYEEVFQ
jgi:hypothetical protein